MGQVKVFFGALLVAALVVGAGAAVRADVTITMEQEMESEAGTQTATVTQYYTPTKMRNEFGEATVSIIDLDAGRIITLMPAIKTYFVRTLAQLKEQAAAFKMAEPKVSVEKTDETEEINGYNCRKYVVRLEVLGNVTVSEQWMTTEAKGVEDIHKFQEKMGEVFKELPQYTADLDVKKEFAEEGLFPIKTVTHIQSPSGEVTATMTVTKIEEGDIDDEVFKIPSGYAEQSF
jgi:hypothetical protein